MLLHPPRRTKWPIGTLFDRTWHSCDRFIHGRRCTVHTFRNLTPAFGDRTVIRHVALLLTGSRPPRSRSMTPSAKFRAVFGLKCVDGVVASCTVDRADANGPRLLRRRSHHVCEPASHDLRRVCGEFRSGLVTSRSMRTALNGARGHHGSTTRTPDIGTSVPGDLGV